MGRPRKNAATEKPAETPNEDWGSNEAAERERDEAAQADAEDEAEDGEDDEEGAGDGEGDPEEDLAAVSRVDHDAEDGANPEPAFYDEETGQGLAIGSALSPRQNVGLDPVNVSQHVRESDHRRDLDNGQTAHERANALDAVSGTPNPGITERHGHSAPGRLGASDMSGGLPKADPFAAAGPEVKRAMGVIQKASRKAMQDGKRGQGYVSLRDLNVHKSVMDALVKGGHVVQETRPGAHFHPETGTVYRDANHREPEPAED